MIDKNSGLVKFNGESFTADDVVYVGEWLHGYAGQPVGPDYDVAMYLDETPIELEEEEEERQTHVVTVKTTHWLNDCGDTLCGASRDFSVCSNIFDISGTFGLEGVAKEKGVDRFEYRFVSFGEVTFSQK